MVLIKDDKYKELLELAELGRKFKEQQNINRTNRTNEFYSEIYKLVDTGYAPHEIIGRKIKVKNKDREVTSSTYYRALEKRKEE